MLLQNLQLVIGKRYESEAHRRRANRPILSVVLDEFAPFGYRNFRRSSKRRVEQTRLFSSPCRASRSSCMLAGDSRKTSPPHRTPPSRCEPATRKQRATF